MGFLQKVLRVVTITILILYTLAEENFHHVSSNQRFLSVTAIPMAVELQLAKGFDNYMNCAGVYMILEGVKLNGQNIYVSSAIKRMIIYFKGSYIVTHLDELNYY